jgi:hypothetical protein
VETPPAYRMKPKRFSRQIRAAALLIGMLVFINACSILNRDSAPAARLGHDTLLQGQGRLVCSSACAERGQCGTIQNQGQVVLGGRSNATTVAQDVYFQVDTLVQIAIAQSYPVQQVAGGEPFLVNFYAVISPGGEAGWVPGWCLAEVQGAQ